jgi:THO complex subunit 4
MSGKLDQSLDEITTSQRRASAGRRRSQRRPSARAAAPVAPAGGIKKATKPVRNAGAKASPAQAGPARGESKVIVSNLVSIESVLESRDLETNNKTAQGRLGAAD